MSTQKIYTVECRYCQGIFDLDHEPDKNWLCPCQTGEGKTAFRIYWNCCGVNKRHHYFSNRSDVACKICMDEKVPIITLKHEGLRIDGKIIKPTLDRPDQSLLTSIAIEQRENLISKIKEDEKSKREREELNTKLLQEINQKLTPKELDDK